MYRKGTPASPAIAVANTYIYTPTYTFIHMHILAQYTDTVDT